jgi:hypothetical protein
VSEACMHWIGEASSTPFLDIFPQVVIILYVGEGAIGTNNVIFEDGRGGEILDLFEG